MTLAGKWYNELGSMMTLKVKNGQLSGTYHTAVGKTKKSGSYALIGRYDAKAKKKNCALGFVVSWQNTVQAIGSVTAWSGQYQVRKRQETILTTWLLTDETKSANNWKSTLVGSDTFTRNPPSSKPKSPKPLSHP